LKEKYFDVNIRNMHLMKHVIA